MTTEMSKHEEVRERSYRRGVHQAFAMLNDLSKTLRDDQLRTALDAAEDAACDARHGELDSTTGLLHGVLERVRATLEEPWNK